MFDIGFWELALIGAIALLVVGPERLPGLARTVGLWVGRIRRYVAHVKQDIERELHAEEVRQLLEKPEGLDGIRDVAKETASVLEETRKAVDEAGRSEDAPALATSAAPPAHAPPPDAGPEPGPETDPGVTDEQQPGRQGQP
jgi:sec-independent protein translocase protein TatB